MTLHWRSEKPSVPGWYWFKNHLREDYHEPRIVQLRIYNGEIALGNSTLRGFTLYETGQFAGPLEPPNP